MGSSTIFRGTVVESTLTPDIRTIKRPDGTEMQVRGNGTFAVRFAVAETFSGPAKAEQVVYTNEQSSACGYPFQVGREYVVFTFENEGKLWTGRCSRTALLQPGVENVDVTWMRAYATAPHGSEIFGTLGMPRDSSIHMVPATIQLSGPESRTIATDADGKYDIRNLEPGEYTLAAQLPPGFATRAPAQISVRDKGCAEVDLPVSIEGRIRGRVVDADGRPVADLTMHLELRDRPSTQSFGYVVTDLEGAYAFEHLPPGDYVVAVRNATYLTEETGPSTIYYPHVQRSDAQVISLAQAATVDRIDFVLARLRPTPSIRVNFVMPDNSPAHAGLYVSAFPNGSRGNEPSRTGVTDNSGMAVLPLSLGREYAISVAHDRQHTPCGFARLTFSQENQVGTVVLQHPERCSK